MSKPKLFVDFDSVLVDTNKSFCDYYNTYYRHREGFKLADHNKCEVWNFYDTCPLAKDDVNKIFGDKRLFDRLDLYPHAYRVLLKLSKQYEIIIVSIGTFDNISNKNIWIKKHLPFIKEAIMLCKDNEVIMDKSVVDMTGGVFIDDIKSNLDSTNAERKILFGKKFIWNEEWKGEYCIDWNEIEKVL